MIKKLKSKLLKGTIVSGIAGAIFFSFGPELLSIWSDKQSRQDNISIINDQNDTLKQQNELLNKSTELMGNLNETMRQLAKVPVEDTSNNQPSIILDENSEISPVIAENTTTKNDNLEAQISEDSAQNYELNSSDEILLNQNKNSPPSNQIASLPSMQLPIEPSVKQPVKKLPKIQIQPQIQQQTITTPPQETKQEIKTNAISFGIFEEERFNLCGYEKFSAQISSNSTKIIISSLDRNIPDRGFRGYEKELTLHTPIQLWHNCLVAVDINITQGIRRIILSIIKESE